MPEAITAIERAIKTLSIISTYLSSEGISAIIRVDNFPVLNKEILPLLVVNPNAPVSQEVELSSANTQRDEIVTFGGSTMCQGGIDQNLEKILPPSK